MFSRNRLGWRSPWKSSSNGYLNVSPTEADFMGKEKELKADVLDSVVFVGSLLNTYKFK